MEPVGRRGSFHGKLEESEPRPVIGILSRMRAARWKED